MWHFCCLFSLILKCKCFMFEHINYLYVLDHNIGGMIVHCLMRGNVVNSDIAVACLVELLLGIWWGSWLRFMFHYSLRMYNSLVERCFNDCVDTFKHKSLQKQEETCVRRCAEKFLKHSMRVGMRFAELNQGAATQDWFLLTSSKRKLSIYCCYYFEYSSFTYIFGLEKWDTVENTNLLWVRNNSR